MNERNPTVGLCLLLAYRTLQSTIAKLILIIKLRNNAVASAEGSVSQVNKD